MATHTTTQMQPRPSDSVQARINLSHNAVEEFCADLRPLLADVVALYRKTKNFYWHMSGPHFRDYHLLLDEQAEQLFAVTDEIAERTRKHGGTTLHSISDITRHQRLHYNNQDPLSGGDAGEVHADSKPLASDLRVMHEVCDRNGDVATASLIEKLDR